MAICNVMLQKKVAAAAIKAIHQTGPTSGPDVGLGTDLWGRHHLLASNNAAVRTWPRGVGRGRAVWSAEGQHQEETWLAVPVVVAAANKEASMINLTKRKIR